MPQKFGKNMKPLPGYKPLSEERQAEIRLAKEKRMDAQADKMRRRTFHASPEDLNILNAIQKMPIDQGLAAAESVLIARRFRKMSGVK